MTKKKLKAPKGAEQASKPERIDTALATAAARYRKHPVVRALRIPAEIADQPPLISLCVGTIAAGALLRRPRLVRAGLRMLASEMVATGAKAVVKRYVNRTRPNKAIEDGRYALHTDSKGSKDEGPWNSFPSGHTAGAVSVGRAFVREYPGAAPAVGLAVAFVAAMQPFIGAHYPSDVAAGVVVGLGSEALVDAVGGLRL